MNYGNWKFIIILFFLSSCFSNQDENLIEDYLVQDEKKRIPLFELRNEKRQEYIFSNGIILKLGNVRLIGEKEIISSEFSIYFGEICIYDIGLIYHETFGIGYLGECEFSERYFFQDTTYQYSNSEEFCARYLTDEDLNTGICFECNSAHGFDEKVVLYSNSLEHPFISLEFDEEMNLLFVSTLTDDG